MMPSDYPQPMTPAAFIELVRQLNEFHPVQSVSCGLYSVSFAQPDPSAKMADALKEVGAMVVASGRHLRPVT